MDEPNYDVKKDVILCKIDYCFEILSKTHYKDKYSKLLYKALLDVEKEVKEY